MGDKMSNKILYYDYRKFTKCLECGNIDENWIFVDCCPVCGGTETKSIIAREVHQYNIVWLGLGFRLKFLRIEERD